MYHIQFIVECIFIWLTIPYHIYKCQLMPKTGHHFLSFFTYTPDRIYSSLTSNNNNIIITTIIIIKV